MKDIIKTQIQTINKPTIGESIRFFRKLRNKTSVELAKELNISASLMRSIENGTRNISNEILSKVSIALDVNKESILNIKKIEINEKNKDALSQLTEKELEKLFKIFIMQNRSDSKESILSF